MRRAQIGQRDLRAAEAHRFAPGLTTKLADPAGADPGRACRRDHRIRIRAGEQVAPLILAEEPGRGRQRAVGLDGNTGVRRQRHLRRRHCEAAIREVMRRGDQALPLQRPHHLARAALGVEIDMGRVALGAAVKFPEPGRLAEMAGGFADQHQRLARPRRHRDHLVEALQEPHRADGRGRQDGLAAGLVVEADIARDDRHVERLAGRADALDAADELAHDCRPFRISEIQVISGCQWLGTGC